MDWQPGIVTGRPRHAVLVQLRSGVLVEHEANRYAITGDGHVIVQTGRLHRCVAKYPPNDVSRVAVLRAVDADGLKNMIDAKTAIWRWRGQRSDHADL